MSYLNRPPFVPVAYKHSERGTRYLVLSDNEFHLDEFSSEGSKHDFSVDDRVVQCIMQFSGEGRYAGPVTIYVGEDGVFWLRPTFEFHQLFVKEEVN